MLLNIILLCLTLFFNDIFGDYAFILLMKPFFAVFFTLKMVFLTKLQGFFAVKKLTGKDKLKGSPKRTPQGQQVELDNCKDFLKASTVHYPAILEFLDSADFLDLDFRHLPRDIWKDSFGLGR
jgi:hypothetical protein